MTKINLLSLFWQLALATSSFAGTFSSNNNCFYLNDMKFQIRSGEIHYPRVPREEWVKRISMAKAMGLNTISTYIFWNLHEEKEGHYDFSENKDIVSFVKLCAEQDMKVIVRPGPYVCAEWDLGGLPAWLLAAPDIKLRSTDPRYLIPAKRWMKEIGSILQPYTIEQGGPILMMQIENEFGSFGSDRNYLAELKTALLSSGYSGTIFTTDTASKVAIENGGIPGEIKAVNFGGGAKQAFENLKSVSPDQPDLNMEFWVGWFDQWGRPHYKINQREKITELEWMMRAGASFNLYMFHGGTTRDLWGGATWQNQYRSTLDSYDYGAPLDESGRPTALYFAFRSIIGSHLSGSELPVVPSFTSAGTIGKIDLLEQSSLSECFDEGSSDIQLKTMESFSQSVGFILYRTLIDGPLIEKLNLSNIKDRVYVLLDGNTIGVSGRSCKPSLIPISAPPGKHKLEFLVENMGRINFGPEINEERKGLIEKVYLGSKMLGPFEQIGLPMKAPPIAHYTKIDNTTGNTRGKLYRGKVYINTPRDTWLDIRGFGRGIVWFNGRNLGRYWEIGPSQSIFLPSCWMKKEGNNELILLELEKDNCPRFISTVDHPLWTN